MSRGRSGARGIATDEEVYERALLIRALLAHYDGDPATRPVLERLVREAQPNLAPFRSLSDALRFRPERGVVVRGLVHHAAVELGLDRLCPTSSSGTATWLDTEGPLPDGRTVLLRWLANAVGAHHFPRLANSVYLPPVAPVLMGGIQFSGEWDPTVETPDDARRRLTKEFRRALDRFMATTAADAEHSGYAFRSSRRKQERDLQRLYWKLRNRLTWDQIAAAEDRQLGTSLEEAGSADEIRRIVGRIAHRIGVDTKGWGSGTSKFR